jgi:hypothetical protein
MAEKRKRCEESLWETFCCSWESLTSYNSKSSKRIPRDFLSFSNSVKRYFCQYQKLVSNYVCSWKFGNTFICMPSKSYACEDFMSFLALTLISFHANANNNPTHYQFLVVQFPFCNYTCHSYGNPNSSESKRDNGLFNLLAWSNYTNLYPAVAYLKVKKLTQPLCKNLCPKRMQERWSIHSLFNYSVFWQWQPRALVEKPKP